MLNNELLKLKCWITLTAICCRPFASKVVLWAILKDFEFAVYCSLGGILVLKGLQRRSDFFPRKSHRSAFKLCSKKVESFSLYHPIENPSKRTGASARRKLKSRFKRSKCVARFIGASEKSSRWLPLFDWMSLTKWLNSNGFKADLVSDSSFKTCCKTIFSNHFTSGERIATSWSFSSGTVGGYCFCSC